MRTLLLGLDGADSRLFPQLVESIPLPCFQSFFREGTWGTLLSTLPPSSPPAWTSILTGVDPGRHGVFHFRGPLDERGNRPLLRTSHIQADRLWHLANRMGWKTGVINVPVVYPSEPLVGFMVSGMLTPEGAKDWIYPRDWGQDLERQTGPLPFHASQEDPISHVRCLADACQRWTEATLWLYSRCPVDLLMLVFVLLDRLQHRFFSRIARLCAEGKPRDPLDQEIVKALLRLDECAERLRDTLKPSEIWMVSDHGFGPVEGVIALNRLMTEIELASFHPTERALPGVLLGGIEDRVDWDKTRAYLSSPLESGILINTALGRAKVPEGSRLYKEIQTSLTSILQGLKHPDQGTRLFETVVSREALYSGPHVRRGPHLFLVPMSQRFHLSIDPEEPALVRFPREDEEGMHRREGLWLTLKEKGPLLPRGRRLSCEQIPRAVLALESLVF